MTCTEFRDLVKEMRQAQTDFFREVKREVRQAALARAKELELQVDRELNPGLFGQPVSCVCVTPKEPPP